MSGRHLLFVGFIRLPAALCTEKVACHAVLVTKCRLIYERGTCPDTGEREPTACVPMRSSVRDGASRWARLRCCCCCRRLPPADVLLSEALRFYPCSGIQFQLLQAGCGVQGPDRGLQASAEPPDGWEPDLARRARAEDGRKPDGEAAAAAGHGGPAGTRQARDTAQMSFIFVSSQYANGNSVPT